MTTGIAGTYDAATPDHPVLDILVEDHALQIELCRVLELVADRLPEVSNPRLLEVASSVLQHAWPTHVAFEEQCVFPMLRMRIAGDEMAAGILSQLEVEHESDEDLAREIVLALETLAMGAGGDVGSIGYLLRSFFESQRRHITWENSVLLPLVRKHLSASDLASLTGWINERREPERIARAIDILKSVDAECVGCATCACGDRLRAIF